MIKQDPRNARIHDSRSEAAIDQSLDKFGAGRSILIDNQEIAIGGNGVLKSAVNRGMKIRVVESDGTELIAVKRTDLSPDDPRRKALAIADNRIAELSFFDDSIVADIAGECGDFSLAMGWTEKELEDITAGNGILDDLVENNFQTSIKTQADVFSVTFTLSKARGMCVLEYIKQEGKSKLAEQIISICSKGVE